MKTGSGAQARRLEALRLLLKHARARLGLDFGFVLWDGSTVPADLAPSALALAIADEGAVAALFRAPRLATLADLWVTARLDLRNGSILDLAARRPKVRTRALVGSLDKRLVLATTARFALVGRGGPWPLAKGRAGQAAIRDGPAAERNVRYHYDVSNAFYALFLDPDLVYSCA